MNKLNFLISLPTKDNDYQVLQSASVEEAARRLGVGIQIIGADNDSVTQSQQLLKIIQSKTEPRPDGILFEPAGGTALPQVANAAAAAGIAWGVMNHDADYILEQRRAHRVPVFSITANHEEVGRIQGRQLSALLPKGGSVLHIEGPSQSMAAKQRTSGMQETKPANVSMKPIKGQWTEESAYRAVSSWLRLSTSRQSSYDVVAAQDDSMATGARRALLEHPDPGVRLRWSSIPYIGCDGVPETGQAWVKRGLLTATVVIPPTAGQALEIIVRAIQSGSMPAERTLTVPTSFPDLDTLARHHSEKQKMSAGAK
ncbi:MAG TPA: substrate-binding domain-containing protein [Terriglobales bacterium]|jgi:ribose transport system substrate-binding protein